MRGHRKEVRLRPRKQDATSASRRGMYRRPRRRSASMELLETLDRFGQQEWLDQPSDAVQRVVSEALHPPGRAGTWLDNLLNGTWLGHPLHPVITDVPIGAWTVALLLDGIETSTARKE